MKTPRHSTVVAYLALFVALSGSAYAATRIGSKQIVNNSIRSQDIRDRGIALKDISTSARRSLRGQTGAAGAQGAPGAPGGQGVQGPKGDQGPAGASAVPARTVLVGAGGTPAENGTALRSAIASLPAASATEPRAVVLGAGRYDLNGSGLSVPADVALNGAGEDATIIESSPANVLLTVLTLGERAQLRDLTVRTASGTLGSTAVNATAGDAILDSVRMLAGIGAVMRGGLLRDVDIQGVGLGVRALAPASNHRHLIMTGSRVATVSPGLTRAVHASTSMFITDSLLYATSTGATGTGVFLDGANGLVNVRASLVEVLGDTAYGAVVDSTDSSPLIEVDASEVSAIGTGGSTLRADVGRVRAGASKLGGTTTASTANGGLIRCIENYSTGYVAETC